MLRAAGRLFLITLLIATATFAGAVSAAPVSQSGAFLPAITSFTTDTATVNYADVEAESAQVTLTWATINTNGQHWVVLEQYFQNYWVSLAQPNEALPLNGSRTVAVKLPENFGSPTFRLTLKTSMGEVIGQQFITLTYMTPAQAAPGIVSFTTMAQSIDTNILLQGNTRLIVRWEVQNRTPDTLIRFEEVFPDGSTISAEPPRSMLWLPSTGEGAVIPRASASKDDVVFRMSLVNVKDGTVYDQSDLTLPVMGNVVQAAQPSNGGQQNTQNPQAFIASQPNISGNQITNFSAESQTVPPGGNVTLNWDASGADNVQLLEDVGDNGPTTLYIQLPPTGTMTLPVPPDAPDVTYTLRAQNADGTVSTGELSVTPSDQGGTGDQGGGSGDQSGSGGG